MVNLEFQVNVIVDDVHIEDNYLKISDLFIIQDSCDNVYADFTQCFNYTDLIYELENITDIKIQQVEKKGFVIFLENNNKNHTGANKIGIFIPCYNKQDEYDDNVKLVVRFLQKYTINFCDKKDITD